jgi:NAD(P) transhydrogenase subunit alpha
MTDEQIAKQQELMAAVVAKADVVITTAQVQGAKAPTLLTEAMVEGMAPGSVIVDLAAEQGGNVESSKPGEVVQVNGVTVIGPANVNSDAAHHSSLVYAKNVQNFLALILKDGQVTHDDGDDLLAGSVIARGGSIVNERVKDALGAGEGVTS